MSRGAFIPPMVHAWCMHGPFVEHAHVPGHSHGLHNHPGGPHDDGTTPRRPSSRHARLPPSLPPSRLSSCQPLPPRSPTHPHPRLYSGNQNAPHPPSASLRRTSQWPSGPPRPSSCVAHAPAHPHPHRAQTAKHGSAIHRLDFMYCMNTSPNTSFVYAPPPAPRRAAPCQLTRPAPGTARPPSSWPPSRSQT